MKNDPFDNQFGNQNAIGAKGYSVRIFLTPQQQIRLSEALDWEKKSRAQIKERFGNNTTYKPTEKSVLCDAFSYLSNKDLDRLLNAYIGRIKEQMEADTE